MALTAAEVERAKSEKKVRRLADRNGLFLEVKPNGDKWWWFRYRKPITRKDTMPSLGKYPAVSLKEVRKRRLKAEELLHAGTDPGAQKKLEALPLIEWVTITGLSLQGKDPGHRGGSRLHWQTASCCGSLCCEP